MDLAKSDIHIPVDEIPLVVAVVDEKGENIYSNKYLLEHEVFIKLKDKNMNEYVKDFINSGDFLQKVELVIDDKHVMVSLKKTKLQNGMVIVFINSDSAVYRDKQTNFINSLSHEIRTPLNGILGSLTLLLDTKLDIYQYNYIDLLKESSYSLIRIVNDILDYSRLETGIMQAINNPFSVRACLDYVNEIIILAAKNKNIRLKVVIDRDVPKNVITDEKRLQQILINLYYNSIKNTGNGGYIHTSIKYDHENSFLIFTISDNSKGLDKGSIKLLLKNGYGETTQDGDKLNLSICKKIITLLDGDIWIDSNSSDGTSVSFKVKASIPAEIIHDTSNIPTKIIGIYDTNFIDRTTLFTIILEQKGIPLVFAIEKDITSFIQQRKIDALFFNYEDASNIEILEEISEKINKDNTLLLISPTIDVPTQLKDYKVLQKPIKKEKVLQSLASVFNTDDSIEIVYQDHHSMAQLSVLISDSIYINTRVIYDLLIKLGFKKIKIANDGKETIDILQKQKIDIALINTKLSLFSGFKAIEYIKNNLSEKVYTIALSSVAITSKKEFKDKGFDDVIAIPFKIESLQKAIDAYLKK